jgi:hypothetical protein
VCKKGDIAYKTFQEQPPTATGISYAKFQPLRTALRVICKDDPLAMPSNFDVVTTIGCLRRILRFLERSEKRSERLNMEFHRESETLFIGRWSEDPWIGTHLGFGMQFERRTRSFAYAGWSQDEGVRQLRDSVSHHRIVKFEMGGLKFLVQSESDAVWCRCHTEEKLLALAAASSALLRAPPSAPKTNPKAASAPGTAQERKKRRDAKSLQKPRATRTLSGRFDALSLDDPGDMIASPSPRKQKQKKHEPTQQEKDPTVILAGALVPSTCTLEIKTRAKYAPPLRNDARPQLYFQRTGRLFEALHEGNRFELRDMEIHDIQDMVGGVWEDEKQEMLRGLVQLLRDVKRTVSDKEEEGEDEVMKMGLVLRAGEETQEGVELDEWEAVLYLGRDGGEEATDGM